MNLFSTYKEILQRIDWNLFGLAVVLFTMGIVVGPKVVERNLRFLIAYPLWMYKKLEKILQRKPALIRLFIIIFIFNSTSLFISFVSGFTCFLPFLFAFLTGLNVAVITFKVSGKMGLASIFLNPVALFELPAVWIGLSLGMNLGLEVLHPMLGISLSQVFSELLDVYFFVVLPLLFISGLLEAAMISFILKHDSD